MEQESRQILAYETRKRPPRRVLAVCISIAALIFIIVAAYFKFVSGPSTPLAASGSLIGTAGLSKDENSMGVLYGKYFFLRDGSDLVGIRIASGSSDPVSYDWVYLANGQTNFASTTVVNGSGTTQENNGWGGIAAGPFRLNWSQGTRTNGWIYWDNARPQLAISSEFATDPTSVNFASNQLKWYRKQDPAP